MKNFLPKDKRKRWLLIAASLACVLALIALPAMLPSYITPAIQGTEGEAGMNSNPTESSSAVSTDTSLQDNTDETLSTDIRHPNETEDKDIYAPNKGTVNDNNISTATQTNKTQASTAKPTQRPTQPTQNKPPAGPPAETSYSKRLVGYYTGWSAASTQTARASSAVST